MSSSSQEPSAREKPAALFSLRNEESGDQFKGSLTHQVWKDLFLREIKITCSVRQDLIWLDKDIKMDLSIIASVSHSNMLMLKDWKCRTHNTDFLNLDENFVLKKIIYEGKGSPRHSDPKHARNGINEERSRTASWWKSVQLFREHHETIQMLTSQLQEMQEQMNSMNDSGEC